MKDTLDVSLGSLCGIHIWLNLIWCSIGGLFTGPVVVQVWSTRFRLAVDRGTSKRRKQFNLMIKELLKIACHLWSRIEATVVWWSRYRIRAGMSRVRAQYHYRPAV
ncbi:hypothetical protein TNCV_936371 [Trichonephila clavipes]|nr:hypothetical protein TNCV_936371 [Trichonephila clavipes]